MHQKQQLREKCLGQDPMRGGTRSAVPARKDGGRCPEIVIGCVTLADRGALDS